MRGRLRGSASETTRHPHRPRRGSAGRPAGLRLGQGLRPPECRGRGRRRRRRLTAGHRADHLRLQRDLLGGVSRRGGAAGRAHRRHRRLRGRHGVHAGGADRTRIERQPRVLRRRGSRQPHPDRVALPGRRRATYLHHLLPDDRPGGRLRRRRRRLPPGVGGRVAGRSRPPREPHDPAGIGGAGRRPGVGPSRHGERVHVTRCRREIACPGGRWDPQPPMGRVPGGVPRRLAGVHRRGHRRARTGPGRHPRRGGGLCRPQRCRPARRARLPADRRRRGRTAAALFGRRLPPPRPGAEGGLRPPLRAVPSHRPQAGAGRFAAPPGQYRRGRLRRHHVRLHPSGHPHRTAHHRRAPDLGRVAARADLGPSHRNRPRSGEHARLRTLRVDGDEPGPR